MNETIAMVLVGLLFSISAGVRITVPLLALNLLAFHHVVTLPANMAWLGTQSTLMLLGVAFVVETLVHFVPVVGTTVKAISTPLAFAAGTLMMAVPLADKSPLTQWALAGVVGGGLATLTHAGVTGLRTASGPANVATGGLFGVGWNFAELLLAIFFPAIGFICVMVSWVLGFVLIGALLITLALAGRKIWREVSRLRPLGAGLTSGRGAAVAP